ncbi:MAG TPA: DUF3301 domain-containing protein [Novimethylophilus sp.]|uniref:DUF3301 domain-containing protein n=1 Tax=Novimethylophilus sp. TaxID=2137426 RepID=UPI002F42083D
MFQLDTVLLLAAIVAAWLWLDSLHKRDIAVAAGKQAAQRYGLQFLDDTVAFTHLWVGRDDVGRLQLRRTYDFEVSGTGADRLPCSITLLGRRVVALDIPPHRDNVVSLH